MGVFPSGQWGQTVNLLLSASVVRIHPRPPRTPVSNGYRSFCFTCLEKGAARVDSNSCGAVAEDSAKTAQWAVFSSAARAIHTRPPRTPVSEPGTGVSVLSVLQKGLQGWIRTASTRRIVRRVKKPLCNSDDRCQRQKQGGAVGAAASRMRVPPKARCSRWEPRSGFL